MRTRFTYNHLSIYLLVLMALAAMMAGFLFSLTDTVVVLGRHIEQPAIDVQWNYLSAVIWAFVLGTSILVWPIPKQHRVILLWLWLARCLVTLGFALLYEYSSADLDGYAYVQRVGDGWMSWGHVETSTNNMFLLVWLHHVLFTSAYHVVKISIAMVGLISVYFFYRAATLAIGRDHPMLLYVLGLYPSILFWSSYLSKDPIAMVGIALYAYGIIGWYRNRRLGWLVWVAAGAGIALYIRYWLVLILGVPLLAFAGEVIRDKRTGFVVALLLLIAIPSSWHVFRSTQNIHTVEDILRLANHIAEAMSTGATVQERESEFTSLMDMITFVPIGAFTALFRPLPGEAQNLFTIPAQIESVFLLFLILVAIKRSRWQDLKYTPVLWALFLVLAWSGFYAFTAFYNLGTAMRFRVQILPILLCLVLYFAQKPKPKTRIQQDMAVALQR